MMLLQLFRKKKEIKFDRTYPAPIDTVWRAWTRAEELRRWWGPDKTRIRECEVDLRIGGRIYIVMEATEEMGKYAGTRWPMEGAFSLLEEPTRLTVDARSWTDGDEDTTTIKHINDLTLTEGDRGTNLKLHIAITEIGSRARMAAFGMRWGYKAQLDALERILAQTTRNESQRNEAT